MSRFSKITADACEVIRSIDADELMMRFYHFYLITIFKNSQLFEGLNFFCRRRFHGSIGQKKVPPVA